MKRRMSGMSRTSLDQYQIPLRPLGRGRRTRAFSGSSQNGYARVADDDDDNEPLSSTDEAPLIRKDGVHSHRLPRVVANGILSTQN